MNQFLIKNLRKDKKILKEKKRIKEFKSPVLSESDIKVTIVTLYLVNGIKF